MPPRPEDSSDALTEALALVDSAFAPAGGAVPQPGGEGATAPPASPDPLTSAFASVDAAFAPPPDPRPIATLAASRLAALQAAGAKPSPLLSALSTALSTSPNPLLAAIGHLDPEIATSFVRDVGADFASFTADIADNPIGVASRLLLPKEWRQKFDAEGFAEAMSPAGKRAVDTLHAVASPQALFDSFVMPAVRVTNSTLALLSPLLLDPETGVRFSRDEDKLRAVEGIQQEILAAFQVPTLTALSQAYGVEGAQGVLEMLAENPEIVPALATPFLLGAAAATRGGRTTSLLAELEAQRARGASQAAVAAHLRASFAPIRARAMEQAHLQILQSAKNSPIVESTRNNIINARYPDPAANLLTRILTRPTEDGRSFEIRTPGEWAQENGLLRPPGSLLTSSADLSTQAQLARLRIILEEHAKPLPPPPPPSPRGPLATVPTPATRPRISDARLLAPVLEEGRAAGLRDQATYELRAATLARGQGLLDPYDPPLVRGRSSPASPPVSGEAAAPIPRPSAPLPNARAERDLLSPTPAALEAEIASRTRHNALMVDPVFRLPVAPDTVAGAMREERRIDAATRSKRIMLDRGATPEEAGRLSGAQSIALSFDTEAGAAESAATILAEIRAGVVRFAAEENFGREARRRIIAQAAERRKAARPPSEEAGSEVSLDDPTLISRTSAAVAEGLEDAGADMDAIHRAQLSVGLRPITLFDTSTEPITTPAAAARATRAAGFTLLELRDLANAKGLTITPAGEGRFEVRGPEGAVARGTILEIGPTVRDYRPTPAPPTPPTGPLAPSGESGFFRPDTFLAPLAASRAAITRRLTSGTETLAALRERAAVARNHLLNIYLFGLPPSRIASEAGLSATIPGELTTIGSNAIGRVLRGSTEMELGIDQSRLRTLQPLTASHLRHGPQGRAVYSILDTLVLVEKGSDGKWRSRAHPDSPAADLLPREDAGNIKIARGMQAWDSFTRQQRAAVLSVAREFAETYDSAVGSAIASEIFREMDVERPPLGPGATLADLRRRVTREEPALSLFRGEVAASTPAAEQRAAVRPFSTKLVAERASEADRLRRTLKIGDRISAYVSHVKLDGLRLPDQVWNEAIDLAPRVSRRQLSSDLTRAMRATREAPFHPTDAPALALETPVAALRHLFPGVTDAQLGSFMKKSHARLNEAADWDHRLIHLVPKNLFTRYLRARIAEEPDSALDIFDVLPPYLAAMQRKIHLEPAINEALLQLRNTADPVWETALRETLMDMSGRRPYAGPTGEAISRSIRYVSGKAVQAVLRLNFGSGVANLTQYPIFGSAELGTLTPAKAKVVFTLLRDPVFWNSLMQTGMIQEALPYDLTRRMGPANTGSMMKRLSSELTAVREAPSHADAIRMMGRLTTDLGLTITDTLALSEIPNRFYTAAHAMTNSMERLGLLDRALAQGRGGKPLTAAEVEAVLNDTAVAVGNVNHFMGRGANRVRWQARARQSALLAPIADSALVLTSYPSGIQGTMMQWVKQAVTRDALTRRTGTQKFATAMTWLTIAFGPFAVAGWIIPRLDEEVAEKDKSLKGATIRLFTKWEREWTVGGRMASAMNVPQPDMAPKVGFSQVPVLGAVEALRKGEDATSLPLRLLTNQLVTDVAGDAVNALAAKFRSSGMPPSAAQERAIQDLLGSMAGHFDADVDPTDDTIPNDVALALPAFTAIRRLADIFDHEAGARVKMDSKGRPEYAREASEDILRFFVAPPIGAARAREERRVGAARERLLSGAKQRATRAILDGDMPGFSVQVERLIESFPAFDLANFWLKEIPSRVRDESSRRRLIAEARTFLAMPEELARERATVAVDRLNAYVDADSTGLTLGEVLAERQILDLYRTRFAGLRRSKRKSVAETPVTEIAPE